MCAGDDSGYRWIETWHEAGKPEPATWGGPECTWIVENATDGQIHLRNLWMWQNRSYVDYLNCTVGYDCRFTYDDSTPATATFRVLSDICVSGSLCQQPRTCLNDGDGYVCSACPSGFTTPDAYSCANINECANETCGANAFCHDLPDGFECLCDDMYVSDGDTCVQPGECATNNGGCAQLCTTDGVSATAVCGCYPGFTLGANGSCVSVGALNLGNVELGLWLTMNTGFAPPYIFEFRPDPARVLMEQVAGTTDTFTFTVQQTPGTCGDTCTDQYRLCVVNSSDFRVDRILRAAGAAAPTEWNSASCQWEVERVGADRIFDCFRQPDPGTSGARRRAKSAVGRTWATSLEEGWGSGGRGECLSGQLLNHDDVGLSPNRARTPRRSESGRRAAFELAAALSGGPRLSR